jgi:hypothetical protein
MKRKLNTLLEHKKMKFGDFFLFQEYKSQMTRDKPVIITKPILAIFLGYFIADQALSCNYVQWVNTDLTELRESGHRDIREVKDIKVHYEWDDYIDILGHWEKRPNYKEILVAYRKYNPDIFTTHDDYD